MALLGSIARAFGLEKARPRLAAGERGEVVPDLALWNQSARIGGGITPARITSIIRTADGGDMRSLIDLANECRQRDAHLQAVLATSEETIASLPWQLLAVDEKERAKDRRAREWVESVLRSIPNFARLLGHLAGAVFYSYAVSEILWTKKEGKLVPYDFKNLAHRRFGFRLEDGKFVWRDVGMPQEGIDFREEHPFKFIVSQPRVTGDIANREGLVRSMVWMSVFRNWVIADWLKTAEISWKPWRIGTYQKNGSDTTDKDTLENVMRKLTTDGAAIIPNSSEIKIEWPGGASITGRTHGEFVTMLANEMSKAVLGQTETTQASNSSGYAQAKVHDAIRKDLREARARQVAVDITRDLIAKMILLNFGPDVRVPRFEFITQDPVDLASFADALEKMVTAGLPIPVRWALAEAGIPEREGDEPILVPLAVTAAGETALPKEEPANGNDKPPGDGGSDGESNPSANPSDDNEADQAA